jgi:hypothetical protein
MSLLVLLAREVNSLIEIKPSLNQVVNMDKREIDIVIDHFSDKHPGVITSQLRVTQEHDDDGSWFFRVGALEVQAESSMGNCPFIVESDRHPNVVKCTAVLELIAILESELGVKGNDCE